MIRRLLCRLGLHDDIVEVIQRLNPTPEDVKCVRLVVDGRVQSSYTACRSCGRRC